LICRTLWCGRGGEEEEEKEESVREGEAGRSSKMEAVVIWKKVNSLIIQALTQRQRDTEAQRYSQRHRAMMRQDRVRGEWSPQPRVTQSRSIVNSNKQYIWET
jgi:hypothetical protein